MIQAASSRRAHNKTPFIQAGLGSETGKYRRGHVDATWTTSALPPNGDAAPKVYTCGACCSRRRAHRDRRRSPSVHVAIFSLSQASRAARACCIVLHCPSLAHAGVRPSAVTTTPPLLLRSDLLPVRRASIDFDDRAAGPTWREGLPSLQIESIGDEPHEAQSLEKASLLFFACAVITARMGGEGRGGACKGANQHPTPIETRDVGIVEQGKGREIEREGEMEIEMCACCCCKIPDHSMGYILMMHTRARTHTHTHTHSLSLPLSR